jgi:hypothetical protein
MTSVNYDQKLDSLLKYVEQVRVDPEQQGLQVHARHGVAPNAGHLALSRDIIMPDAVIFAVDVFAHSDGNPVNTALMHKIVPNQNIGVGEAVGGKEEQRFDMASSFEILALKSDVPLAYKAFLDVRRADYPDTKSPLQDLIKSIATPFLANLSGRQLRPSDWLAASEDDLESYLSLAKRARELGSQAVKHETE